MCPYYDTGERKCKLTESPNFELMQRMLGQRDNYCITASEWKDCGMYEAEAGSNNSTRPTIYGYQGQTSDYDRSYDGSGWTCGDCADCATDCFCSWYFWVGGLCAVGGVYYWCC